MIGIVLVTHGRLADEVVAEPVAEDAQNQPDGGADKGPADDLRQVGVGDGESVPDAGIAAANSDHGRPDEGSVEVYDDERADEIDPCEEDDIGSLQGGGRLAAGGGSRALKRAG